MARHDKTVAEILAGRSDHNLAFDLLRALLLSLGFQERTRGSHHIFAREGVVEILNLQPLPGGKAKSYQVKQVRNLIVRYRLTEAEDGR